MFSIGDAVRVNCRENLILDRPNGLVHLRHILRRLLIDTRKASDRTKITGLFWIFMTRGICHTLCMNAIY